MTPDQFRADVETFLESRLKLLFEKNAGYNPTGDALRNFKVAAELQSETPEQALIGMATKHIVSVYDMVLTGEAHPEELWDEKIGDTINFMLLLHAMVTETGRLIPQVEPTQDDYVLPHKFDVHQAIIHNHND